MSNYENPNEYYERQDTRKGLIGTLILHGCLVLAIVVGYLWEPEQAAGPIQLELWAEGTEQVVKPPPETRSPDPAPEDTVAEESDEPEPTPAEEAPAATPDAGGAPPKSDNTSPSVAEQKDADIALQKKQKAEQEKREAELARQEALKAEARKKAQEAAKAKKEAEAKAAKEAEEQAKKEAAAKAAADARAKKLAQEKAKKEAEAKAKKEAEEKAKKEAAAKAKAAADAKKAAETKSKANTKGDSLRGAMRGDINSIAGIKGGQNDRNQRGGGGGSSAYIRAVQACVEPRLTFRGVQRLNLNYEVKLDASMRPISAKITRRSTNPAFDKAVQAALLKCNPYPPNPPGGSRTINGTFRFPK
ncbi:cell envelope integrity protein TolA [Brackiella oedipodis]|uniref:cell envelope integrity protein TolA n=1 Tax=Brackiella oedipodis TaxID=124225 RepID=UPI0006884EDC|nr:cell envelope integrity protein TolA [Brackiella oedipodis]